MSGKLRIAILIDALGWEIVEHFGFCRNILSLSRPMETVLGYSSAAIPSLLTGELPNRHGAWAMYKLASHDSPFKYLRYLPALPYPIERRLRPYLKRRIDRSGLIKNYYNLYEIPLNILGHFDIALKPDPYRPGSLPVSSIFDVFVSRSIPYRAWTYQTPESENMRDLLSAVGGDDHLLFFYTAELDALLHRKGNFHTEVEQKLAQYERFVEHIFEAAGEAGKEVLVYVFSDHGMTDVTGSVDAWGTISREGYRLGKDYMAFYDSTMARFWCEGAVASGITDLLENSGWGRIVSDEELREYGCFFEDRSYGGILFLLSPGLMIVPSFMGKNQIAAMHGYDPADRFSKGCILTNDPDGELPDSILGIKAYLLDRIGSGTG